MRERHGLGLALGHLVDAVALSRLLEPVEDIVELRCQSVEILAIEGREEGLIEALEGLVRRDVALLLQLVEPREADVESSRVLDQLLEIARALDDGRGGALEEIEEIGVAGNPGRHGHLLYAADSGPPRARLAR
jgi:hypothetical protein